MAEEGGDTPVTREGLKETLDELLRESPVFGQILAARIAAAGAPGTAGEEAGEASATADDGANNSKFPRQSKGRRVSVARAGLGIACSRTSLEAGLCVPARLAVDAGEGEV